MTGPMPRCEGQQSAMAIMRRGDGAVQCGEVVMHGGDVVGGRRLARGCRRDRR